MDDSVESRDSPNASGCEHLVFVYGTLTDPERVATVLGLEDVTEEPNHDPATATDEPAFVGPATLEGLHRVDGQYPTLAPGGHVEGSVLMIDERGLSRLDRYEGVEDGLYVRVSIPLESMAVDETKPVAPADEPADHSRVWVYVGDPSALAVDGPVQWPGSGPFERRVREYVSTNPIVVYTRE